MRFSQEFLDEIRARVTVSSVVGKRVKLARKGGEYSGLCPIHNEKTPSFTVNDDKQFYHCLAASTKVQTRYGVEEIASLAGKTRDVLTRGGKWVEAQFKRYGIQELYKIELTRNRVQKTIFATAGHRWFVAAQKSEKLTTDLRHGQKLEAVVPTPRESWALSPDGVRHGVMFGDGTVQHKGSAWYGTVNLHGDKGRDLSEWFSDYRPKPRVRGDGIEYLRVYGGRAFGEMKWLPDDDKPDAYLLGFLAGYLATDGHVDEDGNVMLNCADSDVLDWVRATCLRLGIVTYGITVQWRKGYSKTESAICRLNFVSGTMSPVMFLRRVARERFSLSPPKLPRLRWSVVSVQKTNRTEDVYCAEVPEHHAFALEDNILTGNCFGCGAHGDIFTFLTRAENLDFVEAVERLAKLAGLEVPKAPTADPEKERLRASAAADAATYASALRAPDGQPMMRYAIERGLTAQTIAAWGLGRATGGFFHYRLMFPIHDLRGRPIGFGGRAIQPGQQPKYLNSPDSRIFRKGRVLFGAHMARPLLRATPALAVVEGYMDAIMLWQHGIAATATLGTGFTEHQLLDLWRLCAEPVLLLDGDRAGKRAAERAIDVAFPHIAAGRSLAMARLPEGSDPDSFVLENGPEALRALLAGAMPLSVVAWEMEWAAKPAMRTPEAHADFKERLRARVKSIKDDVARAAYGAFYKRRIGQAFESRT